MAREIKFRAKIVDGYDLTQLAFHKDGWYYFGIEDIWDIELAPFIDFNTICQFTGLKDKNGKEIYEGDIVRWQDFYGGDCKEYGGIGWIEWDEESHCVMKELSDGTMGYVCSTWDLAKNNGGEVVGNIYENPELLR